MPEAATEFKSQLPPAVRKIVARGEKAAEELTKGGTPAPVDEADGKTGTKPDAPAADAKPDAPAADARPDAPAADAKPDAPAADAKPAEDEPVEKRLATAEFLARMHQGRFDSLKAETDARIAALEKELQGLRAKPGSTTPRSISDVVSDEEREEFGDDLIHLVQRLTDSQFAPRLDQLERENQELKARLSSSPSAAGSQDVVDQGQQAVYTYLDQVVPGWRAQNSDAGFIQWLGQTDPIAGRSRQELLNEASATSDGPRIAAIFSAYKQASPKPSAPNVSLEGLAAPGVSSQGAVPQPSAETVEVWTNDEVAAFYADVNRGKYRNDPEEKARVEKSIAAAAREGRIIGQSSLANLRQDAP